MSVSVVPLRTDWEYVVYVDCRGNSTDRSLPDNWQLSPLPSSAWIGLLYSRSGEIAVFVRTEATLRPPIALINPGGPCIGEAQAAAHYLAKLFVGGEINPSSRSSGKRRTSGPGT